MFIRFFFSFPDWNLPLVSGVDSLEDRLSEAVRKYEHLYDMSSTVSIVNIMLSSSL